MDIFKTTVGDKVKFTNPKSGYERDIERAAKLLILNKEYIITGKIVHGWSTQIWLKGFEESFNSVMFENING